MSVSFSRLRPTTLEYKTYNFELILTNDIIFTPNYSLERSVNDMTLPYFITKLVLAYCQASLS